MDRSRAARGARALAGPLLVVACVLVVLHFYAFSGLVSRQNPDVLPLWLPTYCLMGKSLAAGHIPAWNPYTMAGAPFAADPQSGWMYLPVMALFSAMSCGAAIRWLIVLQPILAGLGLYGFARSEGLSRVAATLGGLALALPLAGSQVGLSLPFSGSIAWTALLLACASRLMRADAWTSRLLWLGVTAFAWGQLAAAHLSNGLVLGTAALVFYVAYRVVVDARRGGRVALLRSLRSPALLAVALPLVNLAYLLPRIAYLPRTSIGMGYERLQTLSRVYSRLPAVDPLPGGAIRPTLPLRFVASPGLYLGAMALALVFAGWRSSRHRALAISFALFGAACYVVSLDGVARFVAQHFRHAPLAGFYLREPARFAFGLLVSIAVLAAIGVDAWRDARSWRQRWTMLLPAVAVWIVLPLAFNADLRDLGLFFVGTGVAGIALALAVYRPRLAFLLPLALAGELVAGGLAGQTSSARPVPDTPRNQQRLEPLYPMARPDVRVDDVLRPGPIGRALEAVPPGHARYVSIDPSEWDARGLHVHQAPRSWPLMAMQQSMLFHVEEAQGYDATEERRYWIFMRAVDPRQIKYNASYLEHPVPLALDLLDVGWIVGPRDRLPGVSGAHPTVTDGRFTLYRIGGEPRAQLFPSWKPARSGTEALRSLLSGAIDPTRTAVVELRGASPQQGPGPPGGSAAYRWLGPQEARIEVDSPGLAALVVRNSFDPNWHAVLDGHPVPLLRMDYVLQGLFVPAGRHTVVLRYDDPTIGYGLLGSALVLSALLLTALGLALRRPRKEVRESPDDADADGDDRALAEAP